MQRRIAELPIDASQIAALKTQMLNWSARFSISLFLDSNSYPDPYGRYECLLGAGEQQILISDDARAFEQLQAFYDLRRDWLFGHVCYDLKNVLQPRLESRHPRMHGYRPMQFFIPEVVCLIPRDRAVLRVEALTGDPHAIAHELLDANADLRLGSQVSEHSLRFDSRLDRNEYLQRVATIKEHIRDGDCYELTFCNEASAQEARIDPRHTFRQLNAISPAPFAAFYQDGQRSMLCASPERFLQKDRLRIRSQPIKGTARRSMDPEADEQLKYALRDSEKEQAENVMITDLVRNDLARSCIVGSVEVEELFGIYSFPQVHQMISTISGELRADIPFARAIEAAFPMGSMTGAPKHRVMQLIEQYEAARRELFSGSVGYISPAGSFDFNVVIRSLFYRADTQYLSYQTGGAITWGSDPEAEWEELRLKAAAMERVFE